MENGRFSRGAAPEHFGVVKSFASMSRGRSQCKTAFSYITCRVNVVFRRRYVHEIRSKYCNLPPAGGSLNWLACVVGTDTMTGKRERYDIEMTAFASSHFVFPSMTSFRLILPLAGS